MYLSPKFRMLHRNLLTTQLKNFLDWFSRFDYVHVYRITTNG